MPNRSAAEQLTIDRMKAAAAQRAGDNATAIAALEAVYGKAGAAEKGPLAEQLASAYAQTRNNAKATEWLNRAIEAGHNTATTKQLQSYLQAASGDYAAIGRDAAAAVAAAEQARHLQARGHDHGHRTAAGRDQDRDRRQRAVPVTLSIL